MSTPNHFIHQPTVLSMSYSWSWTRHWTSQFLLTLFLRKSGLPKPFSKNINTFHTGSVAKYKQCRTDNWVSCGSTPLWSQHSELDASLGYIWIPGQPHGKPSLKKPKHGTWETGQWLKALALPENPSSVPRTTWQFIATCYSSFRAPDALLWLSTHMHVYKQTCRYTHMCLTILILKKPNSV